jgi:hypothetical protein
VKRRKLRRRCLGGVWMRCLSPGNWLSESGTIAVMLMMENTTYEEWELYLTKLATGAVRRVPRDPDTVDFLCADYWCGAFTFGELAGDVAKLADWVHNLGRNLAKVAERQDQDRGCGFGPPDPKLGWYPHEGDRKARQPRIDHERRGVIVEEHLK